MKLQIPHIRIREGAELQQLSQILDRLPSVVLSNQSWPHLKTQCRANVSIAHIGRHVLLKFRVLNDHFGTAAREINGPVHLDNCVEFFISFDSNDHYYNIEFNCLGIGKMAYGINDGKRSLLARSRVQQIQTLTSQHREGDNFDWEILLKIPAEVFTAHQIDTFAGLKASANFYKCGDDLPEPHYLSWKKIDAAAPDFHRPDCFGELNFMCLENE